MKFLEAISIFNQNRGLRVKEINGADKDLRNFAVFMHNCDIEQVSDQNIVEWLNLFKEMGYAISSIIKKEEALIQFFKFFQRKGFDVVDPYLIPLSKQEFVPPKICTKEQYLKLLSAIPSETDAFFHLRNRAIMNLMWNTGMRIGEAIALDISDLDLDKKLVRIKTEKSRGIRPFRILPYDIFDNSAVESLPCWIKKRSHLIIDIELEEPDILFFGVKNGKTRGKRLDQSALGEIFRKYSHKAGLKDYVNAHSLRHHYGTELAKRGLNNSSISEALGHSAISSSYCYTQLESGDLTETLRKRGCA